jgi:hypothetical protein
MPDPRPVLASVVEDHAVATASNTGPLAGSTVGDEEVDDKRLAKKRRLESLRVCPTESPIPYTR